MIWVWRRHTLFQVISLSAKFSSNTIISFSRKSTWKMTLMEKCSKQSYFCLRASWILPPKINYVSVTVIECTIVPVRRNIFNKKNPTRVSSSFHHLFPLLCGVDVSYETPPFSPVLRVLPWQFSVWQVVPDAIQPPPLWSSSPSFLRHLHRHHSLAYLFVFSSQYMPIPLQPTFGHYLGNTVSKYPALYSYAMNAKINTTFPGLAFLHPPSSCAMYTVNAM